jgi:hypothetical protein
MLVVSVLIGVVIAGRPFSLTNSTDDQTAIFAESRNEVCEARARELIVWLWKEVSSRHEGCNFEEKNWIDCEGADYIKTNNNMQAHCPTGWRQTDIWECLEIFGYINRTVVYLSGPKCRVLLDYHTLSSFDYTVEKYFPDDACFDEVRSGDTIHWGYTLCEARRHFAFEMTVWPATGTIEGEVTQAGASWLPDDNETIRVSGSDFIWRRGGIEGI